MRGIAITLCAVLTAGVLTGCSSDFLPQSQARNIANIELVRTIAVDGAADDQVKITVSSGIKRDSTGGTGKPLILSKKAETVFAACQEIQKSGSGYATYGHVSECVVGEQAARAGIDRILDYIQRDFEMRLDTLLFLADQGEGAELLKKVASKEASVTDRLQEIAQGLPQESKGWLCSAREFLIDLYDNGWSAIPVVKVEKKETENVVRATNMALFHKTKLVEQLDTQTSRGACLLLNKGEMGHVDLTLQNGGVTGLKLVGEKCRWTAQWAEDTLTGLTAELKIEADLSEVNGAVKLQEKATIKEMEEKLAALITREAAAALKKEKELGDFLHLEGKLATQYPGKVKLIRANWDQWLESLTFHVKTQVVIKQSYDVSRGVEQS